MKEISREELKKICFDILKEFAQFCDKNNLRYALFSGTLLGSVRHKGFIPWDDDIDVMMPRTDYDKLLKIYNDNSDYQLVCHEKFSGYFYPFAKLCNKRTVLVEENYNNQIELGIYIDIFPIDYLGNDKEIALKNLRKCQKSQHKLANTFLSHFIPSNKGVLDVIRRCRYYLIRLIGSEYFYSQLMNNCHKFSLLTDSKYIANCVWGAADDGELLENQWIEKMIDSDFEGVKFKIPSNYHNILQSLYGDYMVLPPEEKRRIHDMKAFWK